MQVSRVCLALLLVVCLESVAAKPFFNFWCDWVCADYDDDDDDGTTTTTAPDDDDPFCGSCGPQRSSSRRTTTAAPAAATTAGRIPGPNPSQISIDIPPGDSGYTFTLTNTGGNWGVMMVPKPSAGGQTTTAGTTTAATTTAAGATTPAAGATTAAPDATTAAASTAAK